MADIDKNAYTANQADQIWESIRKESINVYGMDQNLEDIANFSPIDTTKCFLTTKAAALLPVLEEKLAKKYSVYSSDRFIVVEKK